VVRVFLKDRSCNDCFRHKLAWRQSPIGRPTSDAGVEITEAAPVSQFNPLQNAPLRFSNCAPLLYRCNFSRCSLLFAPSPSEFPKMPRHFIRLNSQWLLPSAPPHPGSTDYFRLPAPASLTDSQEKQPLIFKRHFHSPTGITEQTTVHLQVETLAATPTMVLNGYSVSPQNHPGDLSSPGHGTFWFPITPLLQRFNLVSVCLVPAATAANFPQLPTLVAVAIVIDEAAGQVLR
jgi:hypothetical protein